MKILAVSDNHGSRTELQEILSRHETDIDYFVHCGDSEFSGDDPLLELFVKVQGNMDFSSSLPEVELRKFDGLPVLVTHGHLYNVKMSFMNLYYRAEEARAKLVFFGHSHVAGHFQKNGIVFINPGSIHLPRMRKDKSYVICEINDNANAGIFYYNDRGEELTDLGSSYKL